MRIPRPRVTVRGLMVLVAVVGTVLATHLWLERRRRVAQEALKIHLRYAAIHRFKHENIASRWTSKQPAKRLNLAELDHARRAAEHHEAMVLKYDRAVRYPWLPVAGDPPYPE